MTDPAVVGADREPVVIRPFDERRESFDVLTALLHRGYRALGEMGLHYTAVDQTAEVTRRRVARAAASWVAYKGERLVGTMSYYDRLRSPAWYDRAEVGHFGQFCVDPMLQKKGIGTLLLDAAERRALADGKRELACDTSEHAAHLLRMYLQLGYRVVGRYDWSATNYESLVLSKRIGIRLRPAAEADVRAILAIAATTRWEKSDFLRRMLIRNAIDVACDGERIVGFNAWNREFFSKPLVWLVVVDPEYRNGGIGSLLYGRTERACRGERLYSSTNRSNVGMQRFHQRRGYRAAGEIDLDPGDPELFYCIDP